MYNPLHINVDKMPPNDCPRTPTRHPMTTRSRDPVCPGAPIRKRKLPDVGTFSSSERQARFKTDMAAASL